MKISELIIYNDRTNFCIMSSHKFVFNYAKGASLDHTSHDNASFAYLNPNSKELAIQKFVVFLLGITSPNFVAIAGSNFFPIFTPMGIYNGK